MGYLTTYFPYYTYGKDAIHNLPDIIRRYGSSILIVGGKTAIEKSREKIEKAINDVDTINYEYIWYGGECSYKNIEMIRSKIIDGKFDIVIGLGGGKAIDTAKAAADKAGVEIVTVPTIAATCAATTALSVVYEDDGTFNEIYYLKKTPIHSVIDLGIISKSPWKYLWAGIGDTIAKYYEVDITQNGNILSFNNMFGKKISNLCIEPLIKYGVKALEDIKSQKASFELEQVVLNNIVSTGFVSFLVDQDYNGACAHGVFYGLTLLEEIEENHLHGEVVAYGVLVLLKMVGNEEEFKKLYSFYKKAGFPVCLTDLGINLENEKFDAVIEKALNSPDMNKMPFKVTREMLLEAIMVLENTK